MDIMCHEVGLGGVCRTPGLEPSSGRGASWPANYPVWHCAGSHRKEKGTARTPRSLGLALQKRYAFCGPLSDNTPAHLSELRATDAVISLLPLFRGT